MKVQIISEDPSKDFPPKVNIYDPSYIMCLKQQVIKALQLREVDKVEVIVRGETL